MKQLVQDGFAVVVYCPTAKTRADIFTKSLTTVKFEEQRESLGMLVIDMENKKGC